MSETKVTRPGSPKQEPWHIDVMIGELKQKLRSEESFLAGRVRDGRMQQKAADFKLETMRETIALLEMVERAETQLLLTVRRNPVPVYPDTIETLILDWRRDLAERARLAQPDVPPAAPVTGVTGGQKSLLVYGATQGSA